jgi:hypothetical protein
LSKGELKNLRRISKNHFKKFLFEPQCIFANIIHKKKFSLQNFPLQLILGVFDDSSINPPYSKPGTTVPCGLFYFSANLNKLFLVLSDAMKQGGLYTWFWYFLVCWA